MLYLDAATDRLQATFVRDVESVRMGVIFGYPAKEADRAYRAWAKTAAPERASRGLTGEALERVIAGFAAQHPEFVAYGPG